ncbi:MAG TPA: response regulator transcription factor, partial [Gemmatimonadaceae bacterium]|nr:response regulator transcription factor [Gemmatimonadaceae bacterium]
MAESLNGWYSTPEIIVLRIDDMPTPRGPEERARIRVLLADDHTIVRNGVSQILTEQPDIEVVAQAADGEAAVALYRRERPDVSLVDLRMPALDGVQVVEQIRREHADAVLVVLTTFDSDEDVERALMAGAKAYLLKDVSPSDLVACVR